jgi:5-formyltetrahydrofolate cyclo-ligase
MSDELKALKQELRREILARRRAMDAELVDQLSERIQAHILGSLAFTRARVIAAYAAFDNEVSLESLFRKALKQGKKAALPRIGQREGEMNFHLVKGLNEMQPNRFGIMEPVETTEIVKPRNIDLILVPGVAYDPEGWRLGMGGGYYDRALTNIRPDAQSMGVGYSMQVLESLPHEPLDQRVKVIVTEKGFLTPDQQDPD